MATIDTITNILQENLDIDPSTVTAESTFCLLYTSENRRHPW